MPDEKIKEVMAMSDEELLVNTAKLFGAKTFKVVLKEKGGEPHDVIIGRWEDDMLGSIWREIPNYVDDVKAAWSLVEYILNNRNGWAFTLKTGRDGAGYSAMFENLDGKKFTAMDNSLDPTPGRAITCAFIRAMKGE